MGGSDIYKPKKFFVSTAIDDDELLVGLETMKAWGVVNKDFPQPNINAFLRSKETMDSVKLWIAVIEKSLKTNNETEEKTNQAKECKLSQQENPDVTTENNDNTGKVADTNNCTQADKTENKEITQEITVPQTSDTAPKTSESVTQTSQESNDTQVKTKKKKENKKSKKANQPRKKEISKQKKLAKDRRKIATAQRRL